MEHHQTLKRPWKGTPDWWTTLWCASTNFQLQSYFKTTPNLQFFFISIDFTNPLQNLSKYTQKYTQIYQNITKKFTKQPKYPAKIRPSWRPRLITAVFRAIVTCTKRQLKAAIFKIVKDQSKGQNSFKNISKKISFWRQYRISRVLVKILTNNCTSS